MGKICVCVVLFRVILGFLNKTIPTAGIAGVVISGLMELTNGCCQLKLLPAEMRLPVAAGLMSLGGICVALQTASVTRGLDLGMYSLGKSISCVTVVLGAWCPWSLAFLPILWLFKKRGLHAKRMQPAFPEKEKHAKSVLNPWWARRDLNPHVRNEH